MKRAIKRIAQKMLGEARVDELSRRVRNRRYAKELAALENRPLDPELHLALAKRHLEGGGNHFIAKAEIETARFLWGETSTKSMSACEELLVRCQPPLESLTHNSHFRYTSLVDEIVKIANGKNVSVLDVGGGYGQLACFLPPGYQYCLAEPTTNGLSGESLPFQDGSFDLTVSCHVLEHVPLAARENFLDCLASKARTAVVLLNPFEIPGTDAKKRMELLYSITGAQWVKEHIECTLPTREAIEEYAAKRSFPIEVQNIGCVTTTLAMVFVDYFARLRKRHSDWRKIQKFYNELDPNAFESAEYPAALLVTMRVDSR